MNNRQTVKNHLTLPSESDYWISSFWNYWIVGISALTCFKRKRPNLLKYHLLCFNITVAYQSPGLPTKWIPKNSQLFKIMFWYHHMQYFCQDKQEPPFLFDCICLRNTLNQQMSRPWSDIAPLVRAHSFSAVCSWCFLCITLLLWQNISEETRTGR